MSNDSTLAIHRALAMQLHGASRALLRRFEARTRDGALSSAQWLAAVTLYRKGAMHQARLAEIIGVEPISISRTLDRMERDGWVRREADPDDRRAKLVSVTEKAKGAFSGFDAAAADILGEALAGFDDAELTLLGEMLGRIHDNLGVSCADGAPRPTDVPDE